MNRMKITIESGVSHSEIVHYFQALCLTETGHSFSGPGWQVTILSMNWVKMGSLTLPRVRLEFRGDPTVVEALVKEYRLRYLSAGG